MQVGLGLVGIEASGSAKFHRHRGFLGVFQMTKSDCFLASFWRDDAGASAAEYALLLAIISAGMALAAGTLGAAIASAITNGADCIDARFGCGP